MLYVAMSGAKQAMEQQASVANNMANVSTPGFRAQIANFRAVPVVGAEAQTRAFVAATTPGADFTHGPLTETGRALDVAVSGEGWLVVQTARRRRGLHPRGQPADRCRRPAHDHGRTPGGGRQRRADRAARLGRDHRLQRPGGRATRPRARSRALPKSAA
jgi:hypothetical protein